MDIQRLRRLSSGKALATMAYYEYLEEALECSLRGKYDPDADIILEEFKIGQHTFREVQMTGPLDGGQDTFYEIF